MNKQSIGNGYHFTNGIGEFMAYRDCWWQIRAIHDGYEMVAPTSEQQAWLDTFTSIIPNS